MDNKVYYGEYSLKHWINLLLKRNITLPEYQRYFVWDETKVETLIKTFKNKEFIPPVTIGSFKKDDGNENYILDGQQRLTSIFIAYLGLYPDEKTYKKLIERFSSDNDDSDIDDSIYDNVLEWKISEFTKKGKSKEDIINGVVDGNYKEIDFNIDDSFLENNFLGFSYLVPQISCEKEQQKYYSSVFRNINIQGETLLPQESRASLYFLDKNLFKLFSPEFCDRIQIKVINSKTKADFVRYLSLLAQYHNDGSNLRVARGYKQKMEKYYEEYIYTAISDDISPIYGRFSDVFVDKKYEDTLELLERFLEELDFFKTYTSIIHVDMYLFGLVYHVVYNNRRVDISKKDMLIISLRRRVSQFRGNESHQKNPNNLTHLRSRIKESISTYERYMIDES